jgi:hypothetical protein
MGARRSLPPHPAPATAVSAPANTTPSRMVVVVEGVWEGWEEVKGCLDCVWRWRGRGRALGRRRTGCGRRAIRSPPGRGDAAAAARPGGPRGRGVRMGLASPRGGAQLGAAAGRREGGAVQAAPASEAWSVGAGRAAAEGPLRWAPPGPLHPPTAHRPLGVYSSLMRSCMAMPVCRAPACCSTSTRSPGASCDTDTARHPPWPLPPLPLLLLAPLLLPPSAAAAGPTSRTVSGMGVEVGLGFGGLGRGGGC